MLAVRFAATLAGEPLPPGSARGCHAVSLHSPMSPAMGSLACSHSLRSCTVLPPRCLSRPLECANAVLDKEALYDICFRNGRWVTGARLCQHRGLSAAPSLRTIGDHQCRVPKRMHMCICIYICTYIYTYLHIYIHT